MIKYLRTSSDMLDVQIEVTYDKGGRNWLTGKEEKRGYYMSAYLVSRGGGLVACSSSFPGAKVLLLEVARRSVKTDAQADATAIDKMYDLADDVCRKNMLKLVEEIAVI